MLNKDKVLLESLVKKYGKNNLLNEMSNRRGIRINESAMSRKDIEKRNIKVVIIPNDTMPFYDDRIERLTDEEFLEYSHHLRGAKIYSAQDFEYLWNTHGLDYSPSDSYIRIVKVGK